MRGGGLWEAHLVFLTVMACRLAGVPAGVRGWETVISRVGRYLKENGLWNPQEILTGGKEGVLLQG